MSKAIISTGDILRAAIRANPCDRATLGAYRDWLQEQDFHYGLDLGAILELLWECLEERYREWDLWSLLGELYVELGKPVEADFCAWLVAKQRVPDNQRLRGYEWWYITQSFPPAFVPVPLVHSLLQISRGRWDGTPTIRAAYEYLLEAWLCLTPAARQECWTWKLPQ